MHDNLPSIPQYFKEHVDSNIDLDKTPSIPCPFHGEKTGRSFSFSRNLNIWRCFGQCHCGGTVVDLHKLNHRIQSRKEAEKSLYALYDIPYKVTLTFDKEDIKINDYDVHKRRVYSTALSLAKSVDDWVELDYILSKVPYDVKELEIFCSARGFIFKEVIDND